nr:type II secretion system F family protein [Lachnospiraceae bacterium]
PMFEAVFNELDNKTSGTKIMMSTGLTVSRVAAVIVFVVVLILLGTLLVYRLRKGAGDLSTIINSLPFAAKLANRLGKGRFLAGLSLMVGSGMETGEAVERAAELPDDARTIEMSAKACELVRAGESLDDVLSKSGMLSGMEARMLNVGLKSGVIDKVLEKLSTRKDEEISDKLSGLSAKIEVALVILLSVLVGVILLTVIMPLISVIASI